MKKNKAEKILTKEEFLERLQMRRLSPEKAMAHLTQQLHDYEKKYKQEVSKFSGDAYDALQIFTQALKTVGPDSSKIRDFNENLKGFMSINGTYNFSSTNHSGLGKDDFVMVEVKNMDWSLMK